MCEYDISKSHGREGEEVYWSVSKQCQSTKKFNIQVQFLYCECVFDVYHHTQKKICLYILG